MKLHIINWGMGVESTAQIMRWVLFPATRPFKRWSQVVIIVAQTGDEFWRTKELADGFILPILRSLGVRVIEVGKAGPLKEDGYLLLSDTTRPYALHVRSTELHSLGENMERSGWVPRLNRPHICAQRWKGEVLDALVHDLLRTMRLAMVSLGLLLVIERDRFAPGLLLGYLLFLFEEPLQVGPYLMYNADEFKRKQASDDYGCAGDSYVYPMIDDGWSRDDCIEFLYQLFRVLWHKSCCDHCPFQNKANRRKHYAADPIGAARAMWREYIALGFNLRMRLFDTESVRSVCEEIGQVEAIALFEAQRDAAPFALFRVRRIYRKVGNSKSSRIDASRNVEVIGKGSQSEMLSLLQETAETRSLEVVHDSHWRAYSHLRDEGVYPGVEGFWVVAPAITQPKCARKNFNEEWRKLTLAQKI